MASATRHILVLIKGLGIGGAEKLISDGARFWDRNRFRYSVAYVLPWKDQLVDALTEQGIAVHCIGGPKGLRPGAITGLRALIRAEGIDLVHAHLPTMGIAARVASPVPVIYTEHNMAESYRPLTRFLNRLTYFRNVALIAVSDAVAASVASWPGPPARVIPNGVSFEVSVEGIESARLELGMDPGSHLVAHVGNIRPGKGHDNLVDAVARLAARRSDITFVSIGTEKYAGDLQALTTRVERAGLGRQIRFLGRRADALNFVAASDVYVNPSDVEGLPVAVLEAMALGKPVVATAVGGVPSIIENDKTGILVQPGDPEALASGVERIIDDPAFGSDLGKAANELVEREFGLETMVRAIEGVYEEVLGH